ncbi:MAG: undecaprenyldiphospho-muramoylpentapeptide beta-N-acetylglucosaminyltransferase [Gammaproteobacteria bacterium]|nr:undecaprenyldiphospho-muramoylpentapeptide beta-N-acetylglucosaminyltransferase [Gammaproteobacteria bacterium]
MKSVMIFAGGTGGHVFPALAVAEALRATQVGVIWVGTERGLEARVVPAAGFPLEWIRIRGLRRGSMGDRVLLPVRLMLALVRTLRIFRRYKPDVALALGGFVSGPGGIAAWLTHTPLVIHEQNAYAGLTNRWLALIADRVLTGFPGAFKNVPGAIHIGNPVRADILRLPAPQERLRDHAPPLRLLVIGGSQGATALNETVPAALALMPGAERPVVRHQSGARHADATRADYRRHGVEGEIVPFFDDMAAAYAWADVVICRAGAMTISEICAVGVAAVLVPYPHAADDHQTANARFLAERGAALYVPQDEFTAARVAEILTGFVHSPEVAQNMATGSRACAIPDATERIMQACLEVMHA